MNGMWTSVQPPFSVLEDLSVWMYEGGGRYHKRPLHMRAHLADKETALNEFVLNNYLCEMYVAGAPGCGKTSFVYYWARNFAAKAAKRILS